MNAAGEVRDMANPRIRKFNPGTLQSDEEIKTQFVVRNHELGIVLDVLRGNIRASSCQHVLVVAPRGRGKTMLLTRAAAEIRTDDQLSKRLFPVQFMEESQEIFNLADFWLDTLFHLGRESARSDPELARELGETHAALSTRWHETSLEEHARAAVLDAADRLDKKLVLMVENLQALSKNVDQDFGWQLRGVLQSEPQIMLLASATSRFKGLDDAEQPFFELFRIVGLEPLGTDECRQLWQVASGDKVSGRNIRPLEILTGGSPRLLVIVAGFARHRSLSQLMEELVTLIDEHTEYFRGHLEVFGRTERRVYVAVIDLWQLSKPGEIAARARINTRIVSTMLGRLVSRGAVTMEGSGKKRLYRAAEPLYSIYFKLRRERNEAAIVENLIRFMAVFYNEAEQVEMFQRFSLEAAESSAIREGIDRAVAALPQLDSHLSPTPPPPVYGLRADGVSQSVGFPSGGTAGSIQPAATNKKRDERLSLEIELAFNEGAFEKVIEIVDQSFVSSDAASSQFPDRLVAWALHKKADAHLQLGNFKWGIATYDEVVARFGTSGDLDVQPWVALALANKGDKLGDLLEFKAAIAAYKDVIAQFGASDLPQIQARVAQAMSHKGVMRGRLGDYEAAIVAYDEVLEMFGSGTEPDLQFWVASALVNKGNALRELGDFDAAIVAYGEVVERFGTSGDLAMHCWVAMALLYEGKARGNLEELEAAIGAYEEVITHFRDSDIPRLQVCVAQAMFLTGDTQRKRGDFRSAIAVYDDLVKHFEASSELDVQSWVAMALVDKGTTRKELRDYRAAIESYEEAIARFGARNETGLQVCVAQAISDKGFALRQLGDFGAALTAYDEVVEQFGASDEPELQWRVAMALANSGITRGKLRDFEAAIKAYDDLVDRFDGSEAPRVSMWVALALVLKGRLRGACGDWQAAIEAYDDVIKRFGASEALEVRMWVARALVSTGDAQTRLGDFDAAIAAYGRVVERFGTGAEADLQTCVAKALIRKGARQVETGRSEDALRTSELLEGRLCSLTGEEKNTFAWRAHLVRMQALLIQQKRGKAMEAFRSAYDLFKPGIETMMDDIIRIVPDVIATRASAHEVADILASDTSKSKKLIPLVVALRQYAGEEVRAPAEVLEVAADIRERIKEKAAEGVPAAS